MNQGINIAKGVFLAEAPRPSIITWNRLEGRPRREDFDRSLRAEVRDPLWVLCRQWQFAEFRAEDAGSAVLAKVQIGTARIDRFAAGGRAAHYDDALPLEVKVEREPVPLDLATRIQVGRHWLRLLRARTEGDPRDLYLDEYGFREPQNLEARARLSSDQNARQLWEAVKGRVVDGGALLHAIGSGGHASFIQASTSVSAEDRNAALAAEAELLAWLSRVYSQPQADEPTAWLPSDLAYQFACSLPGYTAGEKRTVLVADEYHEGHLDWYSFDVGDPKAVPPLDTGAPPGPVLESPEPLTFLPDLVEFTGMPNPRWWELEDRKTDFGGIRAGTTDLPLLMLAELALIYGNDWSVVPYDVYVGTLCEVQGVVVTDVFGVRTFIRPAGRGPEDDWQRWRMYNLTRADQSDQADLRLFVSPTVIKAEDGDPIERVHLVRDEMANMVFGIEVTIPGVVGKGTSGHEAASDLHRHLTAPAESPAESQETEVVIQYKLGTTVPENWIPFIPVRAPGSNREIRLQRARMPRLIGAEIGGDVEPRGVVLRHGLDLAEPQPYFLHEETVARIGTVVTRSFERARWWDGRVYTWLGRRKTTGRDGRSSGLVFDQIVPKAEKTG